MFEYIPSQEKLNKLVRKITRALENDNSPSRTNAQQILAVVAGRKDWHVLCADRAPDDAPATLLDRDLEDRLKELANHNGVSFRGYLNDIIEKGLKADEASILSVADKHDKQEDGFNDMILSLLERRRDTLMAELKGRPDVELADHIDLLNAHITAYRDPSRRVWFCPGNDGGCSAAVQEDADGLCICPLCGIRFTPSVEFEYDLSYFGGDYDGFGDMAYVPIKLIEDLHGEEQAFSAHTGHNAQHIIRYESEIIHDQDGNEIQTDYVDLTTSKKLFGI